MKSSGDPMRRAALVIVFLLALYIGPVILAASSASSSILAEPNMTKDFLPSSFYNTTEQVAYAGNSTWANSRVKDAVYWSIGGTTQYSAYFHFSDVSDAELIGFEYVCYNSLFEATVTLQVYNGSAYITLFTITYGSKWNNGTWFGNIPASDTIQIRLNSVGAGAGAFVDYLALKFIYATWVLVGEAQLSFETPSWHIIATAILTFVIELFTGSLDAFIILLGLIMIPASTLYLVKGGRDEMSSDKFFYFIIVFIIGWALLIGGIMP